MIVCVGGGRTVIGISGSLIWSKILMELIFKPCGEFRCSPEGPVSQIHSSPPRWCPWDLFLRSVQMLKRKGCWKQREATTPIQSLVKLQPCFLSLRWKTCLQQNCSLGSCACSEGSALGQNSLIYCIYTVRPQTYAEFSGMMMMMINLWYTFYFSLRCFCDKWPALEVGRHVTTSVVRNNFLFSA